MSFGTDETGASSFISPQEHSPPSLRRRGGCKGGDPPALAWSVCLRGEV